MLYAKILVYFIFCLKHFFLLLFAEFVRHIKNIFAVDLLVYERVFCFPIVAVSSLLRQFDSVSSCEPLNIQNRHTTYTKYISDISIDLIFCFCMHRSLITKRIKELYWIRKRNKTKRKINKNRVKKKMLLT